MTQGRLRGPLTGGEEKWREQFARRVDSLGEGEVLDCPFLDPLQLELAAEVLKKRPHLACTVFGGYPAAERARVRLFPRERPGGLPPVQALLITGSFTERDLTHRDFLGALLGLGLKRDQVGDIVFLPGEGSVAAMVLPPVAEYICAGLSAVGGFTVRCTAMDSGAISLPEPRAKEISGTVASLRLDSVLALGFGLSRSRAALLVKGGLTKVNWRPVDSPAQALRPGDVITLSGRGRLEVASLEGETRKGRLRITVKKF